MPLPVDHVGLVGLLVALGGAGVWMLSRVHRPLAVREGARSVGLAITGFSMVLTASGWAAFPRLRGGAAQAEERRSALGAMIGLAVAVVAVRTGARLEQLRLEKGSGTPGSAMAKRATFFFLALSIVALLVLRGGTRFPVTGSLCGVWVPALLLWRRTPRGGPMGPEISAAWRATFFGLAVTALSSIAIAAVQERAGSGGLARGLGWGIGGGAALLVGVGWIATRLAPGRAIALSGALCGLAGLILGSL